MKDSVINVRDFRKVYGDLVALDSISFEVQRGFDFGKITTPVKRPEIMLELEWAYNSDVSIRAGAEPMILTSTIEDLHRCISGCDYICLDDDAVQGIIERIRAKVK